MDSQTIVSVTNVLNKQSNSKIAEVVDENQHRKRKESEVLHKTWICTALIFLMKIIVKLWKELRDPEMNI